MATVWTNGCFDLLHAGHVTFLERAAQLGTLTVFLNSDDSIRFIKGPPRPIIPLPHRMKLLRSLRCVAHVHVFDAPTPVQAWNAMDKVPDFYVKDEECNIAHSDEGRWMLDRGVAITLLRRLPGISTTDIIHKIRG